MNSLINLTPKELRKAANLQEKIQSLHSELTSIFVHEVPTPAGAPTGKRKRRMSAAGRRAIAAAARARWAKVKSTKPGTKAGRKLSAKGLANIRAGVLKRMESQSKATTKPKRKMSAAGRAALAAAAKARWAKAKAAGKTTL
jgi:hypothetical protein